MKRTNKIVIFILGAAVLFGSASFWVYREFTQGPQDLTLVTVRLKWLHQAQFAGMYVAKEKGFYKEVGLNVNLKEAAFGEKSKFEEVLQGDADFTIVGTIEFLQSISDGLPVKAVGVIYQESPIAFASLKKSNIVTPSDLIGKVIGITGGRSFSTIPVNALLEIFGIDPDDVAYKDVDFDEAKNLVERNADVVTIFRTNSPFSLNKAELAYNLLLPERFGFQMYEDILITSQQHIDENPKLVKQFVQATMRGWEYALTHLEESVDITMQYANEQYQDRELEQFILRESIPLIKSTSGQPIGAMNFIRWQRTYNIARNEGLLERPFDIADAYTTEFLK